MLYDMTQKFFHLFCLHFYSTGEQVPLIKDWKDVLNKVGDNQVLLQSIKGSPYYNSFGDRATVWETKLTDLDEILNSLNAAQRKWVYLEPYQEQMKLKSPSQTGVRNFLYKHSVEIAHFTYYSMVGTMDGALGVESTSTFWRLHMGSLF